MKTRSHFFPQPYVEQRDLWFRINNMSIFKMSVKLTSLGLLMLFATSCTDTKKVTPDLSIEVRPTGASGAYLVTGTTNLPDQSRISIAGIRPLQMNQGIQTVSGKEEANDSILARQTVEVSQGKWQATLNLWQMTSDGRYREAWQTNRTQLNLPVSPSEKVTFVAVFDPNDQLPAVAQQVNQQSFDVNSPLLQFTESGNQYLQARKEVAINVPTGKDSSALVAVTNQASKQSTPLRPNSQLTKQLQNNSSKEPQTNLPLSPSEFLR